MCKTSGCGMEIFVFFRVKCKAIAALKAEGLGSKVK